MRHRTFGGVMNALVIVVCGGGSGSAFGFEGVENGSFAEASTPDGWGHTVYLRENSSLPHPVFRFDVRIESEPDSGRTRFCRMQVERIGGTSPDTAPGEDAVLGQYGITLDPCGTNRLFVLEFDYRLNGPVGYFGLTSVLTARVPFEGEWRSQRQWMGRGRLTDQDEFGGDWLTAQMILEVDEDPDVSLSTIEFDVEFIVNPWGIFDVEEGCIVSLPRVDIDQVSLRGIDHRGEIPPESDIVCGQDPQVRMVVDTTFVLLESEAIPERPVARVHRFRRFIGPPACRDGHPFGGLENCLAGIFTTTDPYLPAAGSCSADLDGNGFVNGADLTELLAAWGSSGTRADLNCDGWVDGQDLTVMLASWGYCDPREGLAPPFHRR